MGKEKRRGHAEKRGKREGAKGGGVRGGRGRKWVGTEVLLSITTKYF